MKYEIHLSSRAARFLKGTEQDLYDRIVNRLRRLENDPFPKNMKIVRGTKEKTFRVRVGDFRILYIVVTDENAVLVVNIDKRSKVYKRQ